MIIIILIGLLDVRQEIILTQKKRRKKRNNKQGQTPPTLQFACIPRLVGKLGSIDRFPIQLTSCPPPTTNPSRHGPNEWIESQYGSCKSRLSPRCLDALNGSPCKLWRAVGSHNSVGTWNLVGKVPVAQKFKLGRLDWAWALAMRLPRSPFRISIASSLEYPPCA